MANSANPDQLISSNQRIYTVCKGGAYLGSAGPGLRQVISSHSYFKMNTMVCFQGFFLTYSTLQTKIYTFANSVKPGEMSHLIRI